MNATQLAALSTLLTLELPEHVADAVRDVLHSFAQGEGVPATNPGYQRTLIHNAKKVLAGALWGLYGDLHAGRKDGEALGGLAVELYQAVKTAFGNPAKFGGPEELAFCEGIEVPLFDEGGLTEDAIAFLGAVTLAESTCRVDLRDRNYVELVQTAGFTWKELYEFLQGWHLCQLVGSAAGIGVAYRPSTPVIQFERHEPVDILKQGKSLLLVRELGMAPYLRLI